MRFGEAAEQRWKDYDPHLKPRGKLKVLRAYNTRLKLVKETKAERPRHVPVVRSSPRCWPSGSSAAGRRCTGGCPGPRI
jgi:hypothetical protein